MSKAALQYSRRAFDQWKIANPWLRLGAQVVDQGLVGFATGSLLLALFPEKTWTPTWWITWLLFWPFISLSSQCVFLSLLKTTPGKKAFGLHIQSARPGTPLSAWQIMERSAAWWLGFFTLGAGWCTILSRSDRRAWHDIVAETVVVHEDTEISHVHPLERRMGQIWAILVSFFLISILSISLLVNIKRLSRPTNEKSVSFTPTDHKQVENLSWFLLLGELPDSMNDGLSQTDEKFMSVMKYFSKARALGMTERYAYYKENMQKDEDWLCRPGQMASQECQSAQLMAALLGSKPSTTKMPGALPVLKIIHNLESMNSADEGISYMAQESKSAMLHSAQYLALKTAQARFAQKKGEFTKATQILIDDVDNLDQSAMGNTEKILFENLVSTACESQALSNCQHDLAAQCMRHHFWKDWNKGCQEKKLPQVFTNAAHGLGFWWQTAQNSNEINLADWENSKKTFQNVNQTGFEKDVTTALDLALSVKSQDPQELMDRARAMNSENPLWGWAQRQALGKFGKQWALLMKEPEQKQIAYFNLIDSKVDSKRAIASQNKPKKLKSVPRHR